MKRSIFYRGLFYVAGLLVLALGLTLNTKTGLGGFTDHFSGIQYLRDI